MIVNEIEVEFVTKVVLKIPETIDGEELFDYVVAAAVNEGFDNGYDFEVKEIKLVE